MIPTHTHKEDGGRYAEIHRAEGSRRLAVAGTIVVYLDIDKHVQSATTLEDWEAHWRRIAPDDCPVCHGAGHDQIKGNRDNPCGGCYGLGKVKEDGETPASRWELAEVAAKIIERLAGKLGRAQSAIEAMQRTPGVPEAIEAERDRRQQAATDAQAEQERQWREGSGYGPGGRRHTGD